MIIYGLMKYIEKVPARYDRVMNLLTLGSHQRARNLIIASVKPGTRVLDIGCGPGTLALACAAKNAIVTGVDASVEMLRVFRERASSAGLNESVEIVETGCASIDRVFAGRRFDTITISLVLGELPDPVRKKTLAAAVELLAPGGTLIVCDELWPENPVMDLLYRLMFWIFFIPNFILTRTLIQPIKGFRRLISGSGLQMKREATFLFGAMKVFWFNRGGEDEGL